MNKIYVISCGRPSASQDDTFRTIKIATNQPTTQFPPFHYQRNEIETNKLPSFTKQWPQLYLLTMSAHTIAIIGMAREGVT